jgi:hypothetical protein
MSLKSLKIVQNASHYWKKPPFPFKYFKKASDFLKSLTIHEKSSNELKKASNSLKISLKCRIASPPLVTITSIIISEPGK